MKKNKNKLPIINSNMNNYLNKKSIHNNIKII